MAKILTQEWFDKVDELTNKAGDLNLPPAIKNMSINLQVTDSDNQEVNAAFYDGTIHQGLTAVTMSSITSPMITTPTAVWITGQFIITRLPQ